MKRLLTVLLFTLPMIFVACASPITPTIPASLIPTPTKTSKPPIRYTSSPLARITLTPTPLGQSCLTPAPTIPSGIKIEGEYIFNWKTRADPKLSEQLREELKQAGINYVTACANAFGEDWVQYKPDNQEVIVGFSYRDSTFDIVLPVDDVTDLEMMGDLTRELILLLDSLEARKGYVSLAFVAGNGRRTLYFSYKSALQVVKQDLRGAALLKELKYP